MNTMFAIRSKPGLVPALILLCTVGGPSAFTQNLLPNGGFESGTNTPSGWRLSDAKRGQWSDTARRGQHAAMVEGSGKDSSSWRTERVPLRGGGLYRLSFFARKESGASGGCGVSGLGRVNHDFHASDSWQPHSFVFSAPTDGTNDYVRLGQWEVKGKMYFDDTELLPVQATHRGTGKSPDLREMGEAERIKDGVYHFNPQFGWVGANYHRPLWLNRAGFNSDRWVFSPGAELIYRFALSGVTQTNGSVRVSVNYHTVGVLRVEASRDGKSWTPVGAFDGQRRNGTNALPANLFPANEIFVRLTPSNGPVNLQVNAIDYEATLAAPVADATGQTWFLAVQQQAPEVAVVLRSLDPNAGQGFMKGDLWLTNLSTRPLQVAASFLASPGDGTRVPLQTVAPGKMARYDLAAQVLQPGPHRLEARFTDGAGRLLFNGVTDANRSVLFDPRPGYLVRGTERLQTWWCESGWKIGEQAKAPPAGKAPLNWAVSVSTARGEDEAAQLILTPGSTLENALLSAQVLAFKNARGETAPIKVDLAEVAYVHVTQPTDSTCERGSYPDPLPPLHLPLKFQRKNLSLWLTFHVPRETGPGDYTGELELKTDAESIRVPLAVHVHDFELPRETHLKSALGLGTHSINRYHKLTKPEDKQTVYDKYLKNFAEHRISPYSFFDYARIDTKFTGEGTNKQAKIDFTKFDAAAAKWIDQYKFNSFRLPLRGMGGGTFQSRSLGSLEGFKEGTPEFARLFQDYLSQVEGHLRERGWLDKAYIYWFDEPDRKDYEFVVDGMNRIRAAAPGLRRLLTEQPEPELLGHVEIWCGLTPEWTQEKVAARRAAGEDVWWYICCGPKAPYVTEFIDHPGTELRLWPWQSWQYGVQGILIWETLYWTSSSAFPKSAQDPWADPMSYVSDSTFGPGQIGYWGNGDGRFLYPPRRDLNTANEPCLDEPITSIRWENLRDGMEDYEYFWLLEREVKKAEALKREALKVEIAEARRLLKVPEAISKDLTHFTTDPRPMLEHRDRVARMIEKLQKAQ